MSNNENPTSYEPALSLWESRAGNPQIFITDEAKLAKVKAELEGLLNSLKVGMYLGVQRNTKRLKDASPTHKFRAFFPTFKNDQKPSSTKSPAASAPTSF